MELAVSNRDGVPLVRVAGRLDAAVANYIKTHFNDLVNENQPNLVIDMKGVTFVDSMGLTALVSIMKLCRRNHGSMRLAGLQPNVRLLFEITRLDQAFIIFPDEDAAFADFARG
jgi:anti-sigma B factor antagonist